MMAVGLRGGNHRDDGFTWSGCADSVLCLSREWTWMHGNVSADIGSSAYLNDSFLDRVRFGYKLALGSVGASIGRTWRLINQRQASVHAALMADDNIGLRQIFADPISSDLFFGMDNLSRSLLANYQNDPITVETLANDARGDMLRLAKCLKIDDGMSLRSFEPELVLRKIDQLLGHAVELPNVFRGELGLPTNRGIASYRAIQALYQTARLASLLDRSGENSVIEIGPGMGRTAYYAYRAGITDYTTIDLPMGIVAQACFLGAVLGPEKIWLSGDDENLAIGRIKLLAAGSNPARKFNIVLNCDSMTEMPLSAALNYMAWIEKHSELFLSINHDANKFTVEDIGISSFECVSRDRYPMRPGYWEEIFVPLKSPRSARRILRQRASIAWHLSGFVIRRVKPYLRRRFLSRPTGSQIP